MSKVVAPDCATLEDVAKGQIPKLHEDDTPIFKPKSTADKANIISMTIFHWVTRLIRLGRADKLNEEHLELSEKESAEVCYKIFDANWQAEVQAKGDKASLTRVVVKSFWHRFVIAGIFKLIWGALILLAAYYFVRTLVEFVQDRAIFEEDGRLWVGWVLAATFFLTCFFLSVSLQQMSSHCSRAGIRVRAALLTAVYNKAIKTENIGSHVGDVISLVTGDCTRILEGR